MKVLIVARAQSARDQAVSLLREAGITVSATTDDSEAITQVEAGDIAALVTDAGADDSSRLRLQYVAERMGTSVIDGVLRQNDLETYIRKELLPTLKRTHGSLQREPT